MSTTAQKSGKGGSIFSISTLVLIQLMFIMSQGPVRAEADNLSRSLESLSRFFSTGISGFEDAVSTEAALAILKRAGFESSKDLETGLFHSQVITADPFAPRDNREKAVPRFFRMRTILFQMDIRGFGDARNSHSMIRDATNWHESMMTMQNSAFQTPDLVIYLPEGGNGWELPKITHTSRTTGLFLEPLLQEMDVRNNALDQELKAIYPERQVFLRIQEKPFCFNTPEDKILCSGASFIRPEDSEKWTLFRMGRVLRSRLTRDLIHCCVEINSDITEQETMTQLAEMALRAAEEFVSRRRKLAQMILQSLPPEIPRPMFTPETDSYLTEGGTAYASNLKSALEREFLAEIKLKWPIEGWDEPGLPQDRKLRTLGAGPVWNDESVIKQRYPLCLMSAFLRAPEEWFLTQCVRKGILPDNRSALLRKGWREFKYSDPVGTLWDTEKESELFPDYETFRKAYISFFSEGR